MIAHVAFEAYDDDHTRMVATKSPGLSTVPYRKGEITKKRYARSFACDSATATLVQ
jgi:hypothetical protein